MSDHIGTIDSAANGRRQARVVRRIPIRTSLDPSRLATEVGDCYWVGYDEQSFSRVFFRQANNAEWQRVVDDSPHWRGRLWSPFPCCTDMTIVDPFWRGYIATTAPAPGAVRDEAWSDDARLALVRSVWFLRGATERYLGVAVGYEGEHRRGLDLTGEGA